MSTSQPHRPDNWRNLIRMIPGMTTATRRVLEHLAYRAYVGAECSEYQQRVAAELHVSERTVRRAIATLRIGDTPETSGIIPVLWVRGRVPGRGSKRYEIDWERIRALSNTLPITQPKPAPKPSEKPSHRPDKMSCRTGQNVLSDRTKCPIRPDKMSYPTPRYLLYETKLKNTETTGAGNGVLRCETPDPGQAERTEVIPWAGDFPRTLLANRDFLAGVHRGAVAAGVLPAGEVFRLRLFTAAACAVRCAQAGTVSNPGGYFRSLVERGAWDAGTLADEDRARRMLAAVDGRRDSHATADRGAPCDTCGAWCTTGGACPDCRGTRESLTGSLACAVACVLGDVVTV